MFEGGEEWLQTSLDGYYRNLALMEEKEINLISEDAIYQGLVAAVTAGLLNINRGETYFGYSMRNKDANYSNYEKVQELEKILPYDIISIPAEEIDLNNFEFSKDYTGSSPQEALSYIKNAEVSTKSFLRANEQMFCSQNGIAYVNLKTGKIIKSYSKDYFSDDEKRIMEVFG